MTTVLEARERPPLPYHRWSVTEYHQMAQSGLLDETDRVELIEGELIDMAPIGCKHAFRVDCLARALQLAAGMDYLVRVQNPILLGEHNEPQPDIAVVQDKNYAESHPTAEDVLLIVEVSDTTLQYDREVKLSLYARHGIPEVWLLDVKAGELTVYREPDEGQYQMIRKPAVIETVSPMRVPDVAIRLAELLG